MHADFHSHANFSIMVTWQLFPGGCAFTSLLSSASCQLFNTCDPAVPFSLYLSQQEGWSFVVQICNSPHESAHEACKQFAQQHIESCVGFVFSNKLPRHFLWVLRCFDIFFQTWPISCKLVTFWKTRAQPFPFHRQQQLLIRYKYWKRSALWNTKGLAYETKLTVCKHK